MINTLKFKKKNLGLRTVTMSRFLAAALTRVMRATVPIPVLASASVLHSAVVGGSVVGVVRPL